MRGFHTPLCAFIGMLLCGPSIVNALVGGRSGATILVFRTELGLLT